MAVLYGAPRPGSIRRHHYHCGPAYFTPHGTPGASCATFGSDNTTTCTPYMASATGETNPTFEPFRSFIISKQECCEITVTTDAGTIVIPAKDNHYSSTCFECDLTFIEISGDCVDTTTIYVNGFRTVTTDDPTPPCVTDFPPYVHDDSALFPCECP